MKRKASLSAGGQLPAKLSKKATNDKLGEIQPSIRRKNTTEPVRSSSFRERKAPSWLSSYVTNSSQEKEAKQAAGEKPKLKMPRFPTLVPPSKRGKEEKKQENKKEPVPTLLRKRSTLRLESSSPPISKNKQKPALVPTPSLTRKATKIISKSGDSSPEPESKTKPTLNGKKKSTTLKKDLSTKAYLNDKKNSTVSRKDLSSKPTLNGKRKSLTTSKDLSTSLMKRDKLKVSKTSSPPSLSSRSSTSTASSKLGKKPSTARRSSSLKKIKEDNIPDSKVVELCDDPLNASTLPLLGDEKDKDNVSNCSDVTPVLNDTDDSNLKPSAKNKISPKSNSQTIARKSSPPPISHNKAIDQTIILPEQSRPNMLEIVICISTSGALREYLQTLQDNIREIIWRLQSLVPNLRIGIMSHTQGGIHDDPTRGSFSGGDHNYNRAGGHSGTKWLDLGATLSQICAFVDSLESESTVYPDYVQDNLEMALWKLQRCMSWSSCSYRSVIMIGRGRPNRTTFYHQKEHWRGWIRSALELPLSVDIPVIDWELEAKLLAEMGIHVFTIQAGAQENAAENSKEDEGTCFFRRVAEITQSQHVRVVDPSKLQEIIIGICCACHGSELLLDHRDTVRDLNDGVLPTQLTEVFVGLQLHSKRNSLMSLPSMLRNLDLTSVRQRLNGYGSRVEKSMEINSLENCMDYDSLRIENSMEMEPIQEEEEMETKLSRAKTIRKTKTIRGTAGGGDNSKNNQNTPRSRVEDRRRVNGINQSQSSSRVKSTKPYDIGKRRSEIRSKGARGVVDAVVDILDSKAKKIVKKESNVGRLSSRGSVQSNGMVKHGVSILVRQSGKRQIKLSPKLKESLLSVKKGGLTKAKDKSPPVFTELKKRAVQTVLSSGVRGRGRPPVNVGGMNQSRVSANVETPNRTQSKRKPSAVNGSVDDVPAKREKRNKFMAKKIENLHMNKVSPLNRNGAVGKSTGVKPVVSNKQQASRNMRHRLKK